MEKQHNQPILLKTIIIQYNYDRKYIKYCISFIFNHVLVDACLVINAQDGYQAVRLLTFIGIQNN